MAVTFKDLVKGAYLCHHNTTLVLPAGERLCRQSTRLPPRMIAQPSQYSSPITQLHGLTPGRPHCSTDPPVSQGKLYIVAHDGAYLNR